jgi:outer membrane murein-binding lipoprotein Lpp
MRRPYANWEEDMIKARLGTIAGQIQALENERGALVREINRRRTEAAEAKRRLIHGR